jgi:hypothetical protein
MEKNTNTIPKIIWKIGLKKFPKPLDKSVILCYNIYTRKEKEINKMIIKIYVNWEEGEILTEKEFDDFKKNKVADILGDEFDRAEYINDYLHEVKGYDYADLLFMDEEDRRGVEDSATKYLAECVGEELDREFKAIQLVV